MRFFNRLTLTQQWIIATLLALLPLIGAVAFGGARLLAQAHSQRAMVSQVGSLGNLTVAIRNQVLDIERSARQYLLLGSDKIYAVFERNVAGLQKLDSQLGPTDEIKVAMDSLSAAVDRVASLLASGPLDETKQLEVIAALQDASQQERVLGEAIRTKIAEILATEERKIGAGVRKLWLLGALAVPGTLLLVTLASVTVARPMWRLADAIRELGHGNWDTPIKVQGPADLEALATNLEWMRDRLAASEQQQRAFLRHVTHELKTPLAAIMEAGALLRDEVPGPVNEPQRQVLEIARTNAESLQLLIQQLLNYNAVAHGLLHRETRVPLHELGPRLVETIKMTRPSSQCQWLVSGPPLVVQSDPQALEMILLNLLSNAHDFAPEQGRVGVRWGTTATTWWVSVADNGPGVSLEDTNEIFKPFFQGRARRRGPLKGSGLGLSIVRECVTHLGGEIQLTALHPGSEFRVQFPREPDFIDVELTA